MVTNGGEKENYKKKLQKKIPQKITPKRKKKKKRMVGLRAFWGMNFREIAKLSTNNAALIAGFLIRKPVAVRVQFTPVLENRSCHETKRLFIHKS